MKQSSDIDYIIHGYETQFVEVELDPQESVIGEAGTMMAMDHSIQMNTVLGGAAGKQGFFKKLVGVGKRWMVGESLFLTVFSNQGMEKQKVYFAAPYPGSILAIDLHALGGSLISQKRSFLCAAQGVAIEVAFRKKLGTGFFGGEGFIMQKLTGDGLVFIHAGGSLLERELSHNETLRVDTGCLVAMTQDVDYGIKYVGSVKSALFGGEGCFFATLRGPGKVWIQSMPFSRLADSILMATTLKKDEG